MNEMDRERLVALYADQPLPLDRLPYTREFSRLVVAMPPGTGTQTVWQELVRLRKAGLLPRKTNRQVKRSK